MRTHTHTHMRTHTHTHAHTHTHTHAHTHTHTHVHAHTHSYTTSPGKDTFEVYLDQGDEETMRVQQELLDRNDGSFLFRYRLRNSYDMIALTVQLQNGDYVADSPYMIDFVMEDSCYCPRPPTEWFKTYQCANSEPQVGTYMHRERHRHTHREPQLHLLMSDLTTAPYSSDNQFGFGLLDKPRNASCEACCQLSIHAGPYATDS